MCVYIYIYIYIAICSIMDEPRDYSIKWSKSERQRQVSYDITYMWNLKNDTNEPIYKKGHKLMVHKGGRRGKLGIWE